MSSTGKKIRLKRLFSNNGKLILFAPSHGLTSPEMLEGLYDTRDKLRQAFAGGANAAILSSGYAQLCEDEFGATTSLVIQLCATAARSPKPNYQVQVSSVDEALRLGADAVITFVFLGSDDDAEVIEMVGLIAEQCSKVGMPFIAEAEFPGFYNTQESLREKYDLEFLKYATRLCEELGADVVAVNWPGSKDSFREIIRCVEVPVIIAGGSKLNDLEFLEIVEDVRDAGGLGGSIGRNIFEHKDPKAMTSAIRSIFCEGYSAEHAYAKYLKPYEKKDSGADNCL
ncbi:MAG: hypothetical protein M1371_09185 [Actinobacteria bacterium]|nr:hypothetical protein [Actinomycetota bacterium]